jgi:hypothetical protein
MPAIGYPYNLLSGLSDFWTRFFADADQLEALYQGSAILLGQAYLDYLSTVLGVSLKDALALDRVLYQMLAIREDEIAFVEGDTTPDNRWAYVLPAPVISFASIDNQVVEPTASLEPNLDYELVNNTIMFHVDPTNPSGTGIPLPGYARRSINIDVGGFFNDATVADWVAANVRKGDTLRLLNIGTNGAQRKLADYPIVVVRTPGIYVSAATPFPGPASSVAYVVIRVPFNAVVSSESFTIVSNQATVAHTRLDQGSVRIYAKGPLGANVVEGVDYSINYEAGIIFQLTTWQSLPGPFGVDYTWQEEVLPASGSSPRSATTGVILTSTTTTSVIQIAAWAPDTLVDRMTLANNFGAFINRLEPSSEAYRAFLQGIFQLYILGPVLARIESALNVVLSLPVIRNDGEIYQSTDTSDPIVDRIFTTLPATGQTATYAFPKGTPLRADLVVGYVFESFEVLTTAVTVTDYVQTPSWWYGQVIPVQLFSEVNGAVPPIDRRTASPFYVHHVINPADGACIGDPGLVIGGDEDGFLPAPGHPIFRHRLAFVLMDRYLKFHTFSVTFDAGALSAVEGSAFAQSLDDLNNLVLSARPAHTYPFTTPGTFLTDSIEIDEDDLSFAHLVGSGVFGPDEVIFTDNPPTIGGVWNVGDYFHYELFTAATAFPAISTPVTLPDAPASPRRRRIVRAFVPGTIGGVALVENRDFSVDYANCTITRLTAWDATTVNVTFRQLNIGNVANAGIGAGDMPLLIDGVDPALTTAAFNPTAAGWDGVIEPATAPRDIGMVESALIVYPH